MPNRLARTTSPYLRQHAGNPVDWYPWGEEALTRARTEDKPILLSIGYSACHWCHVMAHESFEDTEVAAQMNAAFVNIKVDREERPDLDQIYQTAHALMTRRSGGWPLTMFLTPDWRAVFRRHVFPETCAARHARLPRNPAPARCGLSRAGRSDCGAKRSAFPRTRIARAFALHGCASVRRAAVAPSTSSSSASIASTAALAMRRSFRTPRNSSSACANGGCAATKVR